MSDLFNGEPGDDVDVPTGLTDAEAYQYRLRVRLSRDADRQMREADDADRATVIAAFAEERRLAREAEATTDSEAAKRESLDAIAEGERRDAEFALLRSVSPDATKH